MLISTALQSPRLSLRPVIPADLPIFYEQQLDPLATQMADFPSRSRAAFMAHWAKILQDESVLLRAVVEEGQVAGNIASFMMEEHREVGYWFGREHWGKGLATRALAAFLEIESRRPLYGYVAKHNSASRRVLEKCGFELESELDTELAFRLS